MATDQMEVYDTAARPIIDSVLEGFNGTVFAYGQTSSGKTHTMFGPEKASVESLGIIPRMIRTVFNRIENASESMEFQVVVSMVEIYNEHIKDLQNPKRDNMKIYQEQGKGANIQDLTQTYCCQEEDVLAIIKNGLKYRAVSATNMNLESSRSHAIFIIKIVMTNLEDHSCKTGKLYLVDLAGSECVGKSGAQG